MCAGVRSGEARDIASAAALSGYYDDHFLALRADSNRDLHFVHGIKVTATRGGQATAALADLSLATFSPLRKISTLTAYRFASLDV